MRIAGQPIPHTSASPRIAASDSRRSLRDARGPSVDSVDNPFSGIYPRILTGVHTRSRKWRQHAWSGWNRRHRMDRIRWFVRPRHRRRHRDRGHARAGSPIEKAPRPKSVSTLCWPHGLTRRERIAAARKGTSKIRNARVRRAMIQLAWRFLIFQKNSDLVKWYRTRTDGARGGVRKTLVVALARKILIDLWRLVNTGEVPAGVLLRPV
jgi:hypothetical protein